MKCVVVLVVAVLAVAHAQFISKDEYEKYHNECQNDPASRIGEGQTPNAFEAHTLCIAVKMGIVHTNGNANPKGLRKFLRSLPGVDAAKVEKIVADCSKRRGVGPVEAAVNLMGCVTMATAQSPQAYQ